MEYRQIEVISTVSLESGVPVLRKHAPHDDAITTRSNDQIELVLDYIIKKLSHRPQKLKL